MQKKRPVSVEEASLAKALKHRWVQLAQIEECRALQRRLAGEGKRVAVLDLLVEQGHLDKGLAHYLRTGDGVGLDLAREEHRRAIKGYELKQKIGRGGTSSVYEAVRADGLVCALKILYRHQARLKVNVNGFVREGQMLIKLRHENVLRGYDCGRSGGLFYLALEYVEGLSARQLIEARGALGEELALYIILQVGRALVYLAGQGVTHRDIKPANILVDREGRVKVIDLGYAGTEESAAEQKGMIFGTSQYIAPEQAQGDVRLDVRADIFSLGAALYHMVVGEAPFPDIPLDKLMKGEAPRELATKALQGGKVSPQMYYFLEKMMAEDREIRYATAEEMLEDIERTVAGNQELEFDPRLRRSGDPLEEIDAVFGRRGRR